MRLFGRDVLTKLLRRHPDTRAWIARWVAAVEDADWYNIHDVRADYPSADGVKLRSERVITVFNIKGNEYRLLTYVNYSAHFVDVLEVMTHAEYNKDRWKQRY